MSGSSVNFDSGDSRPEEIAKLNQLAELVQTLLDARPIGQAQATEAIAAGSLVNVYDSGGNPRVRLADGTNAAKFATHFAPEAIGNGSVGEVRSLGVIIDPSVASTGEAWLSQSTPGAWQFTGPSSGVVQKVGVSLEGVGLFFTPQNWVDYG